MKKGLKGLLILASLAMLGGNVSTASFFNYQKSQEIIAPISNNRILKEADPDAIPVESIELSETSLSVLECESRELTATVLPANATNRNVTWTSSNERIAVVREAISNDGEIKAVVTAIEGARGTVTISATTEDGSLVASCTVTVTLETSDYRFAKSSLPGNSSQGEDTGIKLFSDALQNWTLFSWVKDSKNPNADKNATLYQCVVDAAPWAGLRIDADNNAISNTSTTKNSPMRPRMVAGTDTYFNCHDMTAMGSATHENAEDTKHPFYFSRNGSEYKYSFDGINWTDLQTNSSTKSQLNRCKNNVLTVGFDYKRSNGTCTTEKYRFLKTDNPVCVAIKYSSEYSFAKSRKTYDVDRKEEYRVATRLNVIEDASEVKWYDYDVWCFRTLHLFNIEFADGYDYAKFENYLTKYYGEKIESWDNQGTTRGWGYNSGIQYDYMLNDGGEQTDHKFVFPWWVTSYKYQIVNNNNWLPDGGANSVFHGTSDCVIQSGSYSCNASEANTKQDYFPAAIITKSIVDGNTGRRIYSEYADNDFTSIYNTYPNGLDTPAAPTLEDDYIFHGWYMDEELTIPFTKQIFEDDQEIFAKVTSPFQEDVYCIVTSETGWNNPDTAYEFTKVNDNQYKVDNVSFIAGEQWKIRKGNSIWLSLDLYQNDYIFPVNMTKGDNVTVTSAGANWTYNVYIELENDVVTKVWVAFYLNVEKFCEMVLTETGSICLENQGNNGAVLKPVWNTLYTEFATYPDCEKTKFAELTANPSGTTNEQAAARYDYICRTYGTELEQDVKTYDYNFANREFAVRPSSSIVGPMFMNSDKSYLVIIITIVSMLSITFIGGYIAIRKRKTN